MLCPDCNQEMNYSKDYDVYYCDTCNKGICKQCRSFHDIESIYWDGYCCLDCLNWSCV